MNPEKRAKRRKQDLHFLNKDGMVACNPRDREAAHRAEMEGIATRNPQAVNCKKCRAVMRSGNVGPAVPEEKKPGAQGLLVEPGELQRLLKDPHWRILDCREEEAFKRVGGPTQ